MYVEAQIYGGGGRGGLVVLPWRTELRLDLQTSHPENSVDHVVNLIPWKQNIQTSQILDYTRPLSLFNLHACSKDWGATEDRGIGLYLVVGGRGSKMRQLGKSISFDICWRWAEAWGAGDTVMRDGWTDFSLPPLSKIHQTPASLDLTFVFQQNWCPALALPCTATNISWIEMISFHRQTHNKLAKLK